MAHAVGDLVRSDGRIKTIQNDRKRYIEFQAGSVTTVSNEGISVAPIDMRDVVVVCQPDDLLPVPEPLLPADDRQQKDDQAPKQKPRVPRRRPGSQKSDDRQ